jgi:hypothetical protein
MQMRHMIEQVKGDDDNFVDQRIICTTFKALESLRHKMQAGIVESKEALTNTVRQMIKMGTWIEICCQLVP